MSMYDMTHRDTDYFMDMVDEMFLHSENDEELNSGLNYLAKRARKLRISIYEMIFKVLGEKESMKRLNAWKKEKGFIR